jgi:GNAT superfamily N-acetyltransferase
VIRAHVDGYEIDDDPARIDAAAAVEFLTTQAYWGRHRSGDQIRRQIAAAWRVIGAYDGAGAMVGFARAFSDGVSAYLADVYVLPGHRGAGLGKAIVRAMIDDGPGAGFRWMLHTADAHGLYRQFGFTEPDGLYMERPGRIPATAALS